MGYYDNSWQQINRLIRDAVNTINFDNLKDQIRQTADDIIYGPQDQARDSSDAYHGTSGGSNGYQQGSSYTSGQSHTNSAGGDDWQTRYHAENWQTYKKRPGRTQGTSNQQTGNAYTNGFAGAAGNGNRYSGTAAGGSQHSGAAAGGNTNFRGQAAGNGYSGTAAGGSQHSGAAAGGNTNFRGQAAGNGYARAGNQPNMAAGSGPAYASGPGQRAPAANSGIYGFPVVSSPKGRLSGWLLTLGGGAAFVLTAFWFLLELLTWSMMPGPEMTGSLLVTFIFLIIFFLITMIGTRQRKRVKRYRGYIESLKGKTFESFKNLAALQGRSVSYITKDLSSMLKLGYFPEGHIDRHKTCIMLTDDIYNQYLQMMESSQAAGTHTKDSDAGRTSANRQGKKASGGADVGPDVSNGEVSELEEQGRRYQEAIRKANDDIEDFDISNKLYRMESIVEEIFDYVKKHPEKADHLSKFENYYMPMTIKLLETYKELDGQEIEGDNIKKVKLEIAQTLDTINEAFVTLYDSMYQDTAMDVSSDISVLRTLLAQEGLTESELDKLKKK